MESGGGCRAPIGAIATIVDGELDLLGGYVSPDGTALEIARRRGPAEAGVELGRALARNLARVIRFPAPGSRDTEQSSPIAPRVLVTRAAQQAGELVSRLRDVGLDPVRVPTIAIELDAPGGALDGACGLLHTYQWVVVTSTNGAWAILKAAGRILTELGIPSWAAIGPATSAVLEREGIDVQFRPTVSNGKAMADELPIVVGDRVLVIRGDLADDDMAGALRARGAEVDDVVAYRTHEAPESSRGLLRAAAEGGPLAAVVLTSGSTVRGLVSLGLAESIDVRAMPAICIGPETADEARAAGFRILAVSPTPDSGSLAAATAAVVALVPQEIA
jgi:uroporphyrinogen-III synthase